MHTENINYMCKHHYDYYEVSFGTIWLISPYLFLIRPRPNVKLLMRQTKLIELSSWKVGRLAQLSSSEWVWIVWHVLSIWTRDHLQNKCQSSHATNYTNKLKVCLFLLLIWFSWLVQCIPSSTSDPTTFGLGLSFHSYHLDYFHLCGSLLLLQI